LHSAGTSYVSVRWSFRDIAGNYPGTCPLRRADVNPDLPPVTHRRSTVRSRIAPRTRQTMPMIIKVWYEVGVKTCELPFSPSSLLNEGL
jgi:hypothetical protein